MILGPTGLVGKHLLHLLLNDPLYEEVRTYHRRSTGIDHPKLNEVIGDAEQMTDHPSAFQVEDIYVCVGTTKAKTPDKSEYEKIDLGIPLNAALLGKERKAERILVVSAMGANPKSSIFYNRLKGDMESQVYAVGIPETYFFRPSLIMGDRDESRMGEGLAKVLFKWMDPIIPKKYKGVKASEIAEAMRQVAHNGNKEKVIENDQILSLTR